MKPTKLDAAALLHRLAELRKGIPFLEEKAPPRTGDGRFKTTGGMQPRTAEEFEALALAEGLESFASDLSAAIERKRAEAVEKALEIYYAAEELSHDPAHADLIPHVERMREAYERDFGRPIPPRPKE